MSVSSTGTALDGATSDAAATAVGMAVEVVVLPVSDVERAKSFYASLGWRLDADVSNEGFRLVQFTPPGSGASVQFGERVTSAPPGSAQGNCLVVSDIEATREVLAARGVQIGEIFHEGAVGARFAADADARVAGPAPDRASYRSFATLQDPDGNGWLLQEITSRLPGRVEAGTTSFPSAEELAAAMRRASVAHGAHERRIGHADENWPRWYAEYMVAERSGSELPT